MKKLLLTTVMLLSAGQVFSQPRDALNCVPLSATPYDVSRRSEGDLSLVLGPKKDHPDRKKFDECLRKKGMNPDDYALKYRLVKMGQ